MWKILMKDVDLGDPTSFLDHVYLGCTETECQTSKDIVDNYRRMFESRISAGAIGKLRSTGKLDANISSWSYDMEGHAKKCVERYRELANKTTQQLYKVSTPCLDDNQFQEEEMGSVGELSKVCWQIVRKRLCLARIGRPGFLWSVDKLARAITKWTSVCDKRLAHLISYIYHTCEFKQNCLVGNTARRWRLGLFQDSDFAEDLEDSKSTSGGLLCIFGSHTFVQVSWMCKKQTSVSHSSTEAEIISFDAGSPMDGIPALDLWDFVIEVFHSSQTNSTTPTVKYRETCRVIPHQTSRPKTNTRFQPSTTTLIWTILTVSRRTRSFLDLVVLYIFEDIAAVIKRIIKGRSPTMRHVSRTHRVALDWLFDRISLDPKNSNQVCRHQTPTCRHIDKKGISHAMSGTIFFICLTSAISAFSAAFRISAWPAAPKRWRKGCKSRKKRTESWQSQKRRWTWSHCLDKLFDCAEYDCVEKPGDTQSTLSNSLVNYRETWRKRSQSRRSVEFSRMAKRCTSGH